VPTGNQSKDLKGTGDICTQGGDGFRGGIGDENDLDAGWNYRRSLC
jgi:hypothetical protein